MPQEHMTRKALFLTLGVYSGHCGQGDVCWWDNLEVRRTEHHP